MKLIPLLSAIIFSCKKNGSSTIRSVTVSGVLPDSGAYGEYVAIVRRGLTAPDSVTLNGKRCHQ